MNWKFKAKLLAALSVAPFGAQLHYQIQRHVTREWPRRDAVLGLLLIAAKRVFAATDTSHGHLLEIGAGGDLAVAVALRLMGVRQVTCVDVTHQARPELVAHAATYMARTLGVPVPTIRHWKDVEAFGIRYLAPTTLQAAKLPSAQFDAFFSIDTLEHIPITDLRGVFTEARRLVRPGGRFVHCIDYSDHFARSDNELSRFNFLRYTESAWRPFNSRLQYVNRLRHSDYLALHAELGLSVLRAEPDCEPPQRAIIERLALEFRRYDVGDLFTIRAMIVSAA